RRAVVHLAFHVHSGGRAGLRREALDGPAELSHRKRAMWLQRLSEKWSEAFSRMSLSSETGGSGARDTVACCVLRVSDCSPGAESAVATLVPFVIAAAVIALVSFRKMVWILGRLSGPTMTLVSSPLSLTWSTWRLFGSTASLIPSTFSVFHFRKSLNSTSSVVRKLLSAKSPVKLASGAPGSGAA